MIKEENAKIITLSFLSAGFLTAFVVRIVFELLAIYSGMVALAYGQDGLRHGIPVLAGLLVFLILQTRKKPGYGPMRWWWRCAKWYGLPVRPL